MTRYLLAAFAALGITMLYATGTKAQEDKPVEKIELTKMEQDLLSDYHGDVKIPDALLRAFAKFVEATEDANEEQLKTFCLPYSVQFSSDQRTGLYREYGTGINLPFLKSHFHKQILNLRWENDSCLLVRTGSSYIRYVQTSKNEWKIYNYGDKPIE